VEDSGTWPVTVKIGSRGRGWQKDEERRVEYGEGIGGNYEQLNNLKEIENLELLD